jgi:WD40 repeat protein
MGGFDLYSFNRASPLRTFAIPHTQKYVKQGAFGERSTIAACGSDHGKVYVFKLGSPDILQTLRHCRSKLGIDRIRGTLTLTADSAMVQTVKVSALAQKNASHAEYAFKCASSPDRHLIASGSSGGQFNICLWEKSVNQGSESANAHGRKGPNLFVIVNSIVLLFMLWAMSDLWKPFLSGVSR